MDDTFLWGILTIVSVVAAIAFVARKTKGKSALVRAGFIILAVILPGALLGAVRPFVERMLYETSDDYAWSKIHKAIVSGNPTMGQMIGLSPAIESEFRSKLLGAARQYGNDRAKLTEVVANLSADIYVKHVFPVAIHGSDEALAAWGAQIVPELRTVADISQEACGDYAMAGVNRYPTDPRVVAAISASQKAVLEAYRTSDKAKYRLPDQDTVATLYEKAVTLVDPPFTRDELLALEALGKQPKAQVCNLLIRLFAAVGKLDTRGKAAIYRIIMKERM